MKHEKILTDRRPMSAQEYNDALDRLGLNQSSVARLLNFSVRMSNRYSQGEWPVPVVTGALLRLMVKRKVTPAELDLPTATAQPRKAPRRKAAAKMARKTAKRPRATKPDKAPQLSTTRPRTRRVKRQPVVEIAPVQTRRQPKRARRAARQDLAATVHALHTAKQTAAKRAAVRKPVVKQAANTSRRAPAKRSTAKRARGA